MFYFLETAAATGENTGFFDCDSGLKPIFSAALLVIRVIQVAVPFALVIWGSLDWFKALIAGDEKEMKAKRKPFISRLVAAIVILVLPWLVKLVAKQIAGQSTQQNFWTCYATAEPGLDFTEWNTDDQESGNSSTNVDPNKKQ